jgi:hypothetical protein
MSGEVPKVEAVAVGYRFYDPCGAFYNKLKYII